MLQLLYLQNSNYTYTDAPCSFDTSLVSLNTPDPSESARPRCAHGKRICQCSGLCCPQSKCSQIWSEHLQGNYQWDLPYQHQHPEGQRYRRWWGQFLILPEFRFISYPVESFCGCLWFLKVVLWEEKCRGWEMLKYMLHTWFYANSNTYLHFAERKFRSCTKFCYNRDRDREDISRYFSPGVNKLRLHVVFTVHERLLLLLLFRIPSHTPSQLDSPWPATTST